jgi:hypothetical protein
MVIDAKRIFTCTHTFVSVTDRGVLQFACASCGYRTELLPLHRPQRPAHSELVSLSGETITRRTGSARPARQRRAGKA